MFKPAKLLALPLSGALLLAGCNNSRDEDDIAARPTADITASDAAAGMATMIPPVGNPSSPANQSTPGAIPSKEPSSIPGATNTATGKMGDRTMAAPTDAGRSGVNRTTRTTSNGANRPNAGATTPAIRQE